MIEIQENISLLPEKLFRYTGVTGVNIALISR